MAPKLPSNSVQVLQVEHEPKIQSKSQKNSSKMLHQPVHTDHPNIEHRSKVSETCGAIDSLYSSKISILNHVEKTKTISSPTGDSPLFFLNANPMSPIPLSPTSTASSPSSPGVNNDIWEPPETPCRQSRTAAESQATTPLTPPTTYNVNTSPSSPFTFGTKRATKIERPIFVPDARHAENEHKETTEKEDYFPRRKLFRMPTTEAEAINKKNTMGSDLKLSKSPSFNFSISSKNSGSTKTTVKVKMEPTQGDIHAVPKIAIKSPEVYTHAKAAPRTQRSTNSLTEALEQIIPPEIHARLVVDSTHCVASLVTSRQQRCDKRVHVSSEKVDKILKAMLKYNKRADYVSLIHEIERLVPVVMCSLHQKTALFGPPSSPRMEKLRKVVSDLSEAPGRDHSCFDNWKTAILNRGASSNADGAIKHEPAIEEAPRTRKSHTAHTTSAPTSGAKVVNLFGFEPYQTKRTANLSVPQALQDEIQMPMKKGSKDGYIYMFWDQEKFGMVKIGRTVNLEARLKQWNKQCKRTHVYHKASESGELPQVPHVSRIERLIHIELKERRKQRRCEGCGTNHIEWFDVTEAHAVKVFQKWEKWISQDPYAFDPVSNEWQLKQEMLDTLQQVCEPVPWDRLQQKSHPKRRNRTSNSRRKSTPLKV